MHSLGRTLLLALTDSGASIPVDFCLCFLDKVVLGGIKNPSYNLENIFQFLPYSFFSHLLQISGIRSRIPAILLATVDLHIPHTRKKGGARNLLQTNHLIQNWQFIEPHESRSYNLVGRRASSLGKLTRKIFLPLQTKISFAWNLCDFCRISLLHCRWILRQIQLLYFLFHFKNELGRKRGRAGSVL